MLTQLSWQAALVAVVLWWMYFLSRYVVRAIELLLQRQDDDFLNSSYPVFTKRAIRDTHNRAIAASRERHELQADVVNDPKFIEAAQKHSIPDEISKMMLAVTEAMVQAESNWCRHSCMMDANIAVLTGKLSRDAALAEALKRLELTSGITTALDADMVRDEWKDRLEGRRDEDPSPRPYRTPWSEMAH